MTAEGIVGRRRTLLLVLAVLLGFGVSASAAPSSSPVTSRYLEMRDGVQIAVDVMLPDAALRGQRLPTILDATRYGRRSHVESAMPFLQRGFAVVIADARGTGASFGTWAVLSPTEIADYGQVVDWIATQPWSNGRVGTYGISYDAGTAELTAATHPTALRAVAPTYFTDDLYDDVVYPGGLFNRRFVFWWSAFVTLLDRGEGATAVDGDGGAAQMSAAVAGHGANMNVFASAVRAPYRDDQFGPVTYAEVGAASHRAAISGTGVAYLVVTGWLDGADARGALRRYMNQPNSQLVVIGPWNHGGSTDANPFRPAGAPRDPSAGRGLVASFFHATLSDGAAAPSTREVRYFTLGENRWHETTVWPPRGLTTRRLYLAPRARLGHTPPSATSGADRYRVRFNASTGFRNRWFLTGDDVVYPDRRSEDRKLLTYTSAALARPTEVTGTVVVSLTLASTARDGAFFAYLEDVAPSGRVTYVTEGELRAASRRLLASSSPLEAGGPLHSFTRAAARPLTPGRPVQLRLGMIPTSVLFARGHRIRLALAGADSGTFGRLPATGRPRLTVFHDAARVSWIDLPERAGAH